MLRIDACSHAPIYVQIADGIREEIAEGRLAPGDPLPSIRGLSGSLKVSQSTVIQAYRQLLSSGVAIVRRGRGTYVASAGGPHPVADAMIRATVERALRLGLTPADVRGLVDRHLATARR